MDSQQRNGDQESSANNEENDIHETDHGYNSMENRSVANRHLSHRNDKGAYKEIVEWIKALVIAVVLVFFIRQFLFSPYIVDGPSMQPNFQTGERLIVNKILYTFKEPKFGDVVVFDVPEQGRKFIKRVIGVPGDQVRLEGDDLYINDVKVEEPYIAEAIAEAKEKGVMYNGQGNRYDFPNDTVKIMTVPDGTILAFGDNRSDSTDSRFIGFVNDDEIVGRADIIFWPLDKLEFIKHSY